METKQYGIFITNKLQPKGRIHSNLLESSIIETNGNVNPILCNSNHEVIDGHGRLEICMKHNLPLKYTILEVNDSGAMVYLNTTSRAWTAIDYIGFNGANDDKYLDLYWFMIRTKASMSVLYSWYSMSLNKIINKCDISHIDLLQLQYKINYMNKIKSIIKIKTTNAIIRSLGILWSQEDFDSDLLLEKLEKYWNKLHPIGKVDGQEALLFALSEIYDYKSHSKANLYLRIRS
jgi:hypothetical protein